MPDTLDIQKVISTSTSSVSIDDLNKKGFKQVKVLNQAIITKLIGEAVDRVLSERSREIGKEERDKVIKEARSQFETLAKKRLEKERGRIDELERANGSLEAELETIRKRLQASVEVQATRDQALARMESLESEVGKLRKDLPELEVQLAREKAERARLEAELARLKSTETQAQRAEQDLAALKARLATSEETLKKSESAVASLREALGEEEKKAAVLEGQLAAKNEELDRSKSSGQADSATVEKLLEAVGDRLGKAPQADMGQIMLSLDGLSRRLANMGSGGGPATEADTELTKDFALNQLFDKEKEGGIETNAEKVKVKEKKAAGVNSALAKLKKLQQGIADGE